jgi:Cytoplasmic tRNA 2-thiolation protein 2
MWFPSQTQWLPSLKKCLSLDIYVARPLKELSDTEINAYLSILNDIPLTKDPSSDPSKTRTNGTTETKPPTTIDEMMSQYISGLEISFPSIVSTTGHTAEKLDFPQIDEREGGNCLLCSMPKQRDHVKDWLDDITVTQAAPEEAEGQREGVEDPDGEARGDVTGEVCYGCYTLFRGTRGVVAWPI